MQKKEESVFSLGTASESAELVASKKAMVSGAPGMNFGGNFTINFTIGQ